MWKPEETGEGRKDRFFIVYPPNDFYNYYHYKNGFRAWGDYPIGGKIRLLISFIALAVSIIAYIKA